MCTSSYSVPTYAFCLKHFHHQGALFEAFLASLTSPPAAHFFLVYVGTYVVAILVRARRRRQRGWVQQRAARGTMRPSRKRREGRSGRKRCSGGSSASTAWSSTKSGFASSGSSRRRYLLPRRRHCWLCIVLIGFFSHPLDRVLGLKHQCLVAKRLSAPKLHVSGQLYMCRRDLCSVTLSPAGTDTLLAPECWSETRPRDFDDRGVCSCRPRSAVTVLPCGRARCPRCARRWRRLAARAEIVSRTPRARLVWASFFVAPPEDIIGGLKDVGEWFSRSLSSVVVRLLGAYPYPRRSRSAPSAAGGTATD